MTAQQAIDAARRDFPDRSDTEALADLNIIHARLCFENRLIPATETVNLVSGTESYALPSNVVRVYGARYRTSATEYTALGAVSRDYLNTAESDWASLTDGEPERFFVEAGYVYLVPAPGTTTSGGYPVLELETGKTSTLSSGTSLPTLPSYDVYITGLQLVFATRLQDPRIGYYKSLHEDAVRRLGNIVHSSASGVSVRFVPSMGGWGGRR